MNKHSRKIRNAEKIESPVTEEQVASTESIEAINEHIERTEEQVDVVTDPVSVGETPQDVEESQEEPSTDTGTEEQVTGSTEAPESVEEPVLNEGEAKTEEPAPVVGRKAAIKDDSLVNVLMTENFQRKGTYSFKYNEDLIAEKNLTAGKAMNELGIPRHHLLYLSKEGKVEITNAVVAETPTE